MAKQLCGCREKIYLSQNSCAAVEKNYKTVIKWVYFVNCLLERDLELGGGGKIKPVRTLCEREVLTGSRLRPLPHRHEKTGVHYVL